MERGSEGSVRKIVLLSANPRNTPPLRLNQELRQISEAFERCKQRDVFRIEMKLALSIKDLRRAILDNQPEVVHFCGHGAGGDGIACEEEDGHLKLIPTSALADLFRLVKSHVKCVVLNACYSEIQAEEIAKHIDYVVGMKAAIGDPAAISFSEGFYDALGAGKDFDDCFLFGASAIHLENIPEYLTPVLKKKA
jgi:hypothetical protein